jgi:hypothetical protein
MRVSIFLLFPPVHAGLKQTDMYFKDVVWWEHLIGNICAEKLFNGRNYL